MANIQRRLAAQWNWMVASPAAWRDARCCVVDIEATGLDPRTDRVISYGAVPVTGGRVDAGDALYRLVNPGRDVPEESIVIHGILPDDLQSAPSGPEAFAPLAGMLDGRVMVGHASWVELAFLRGPLRRHGLRLRSAVDTAVLWRLLAIERSQRDPGYRSLAKIATELGLPVHRQHHALGDALTTAQVFLALATHLEPYGHGERCAACAETSAGGADPPHVHPAA